MHTCQGHKSTKSKGQVALTDQEVDGAAEDDGGDSAQRNVRQDLGQEVDGHPVVAADVLVPAAGHQVEISGKTLFSPCWVLASVSALRLTQRASSL